MNVFLASLWRILKSKVYMQIYNLILSGIDEVSCKTKNKFKLCLSSYKNIIWISCSCPRQKYLAYIRWIEFIQKLDHRYDKHLILFIDVAHCFKSNYMNVASLHLLNSEIVFGSCFCLNRFPLRYFLHTANWTKAQHAKLPMGCKNAPHKFAGHWLLKKPRNKLTGHWW